MDSHEPKKRPSAANEVVCAVAENSGNVSSVESTPSFFHSAGWQMGRAVLVKKKKMKQL